MVTIGDVVSLCIYSINNSPNSLEFERMTDDLRPGHLVCCS